MNQKRRRASAHPTKAFFVRMLTRDISLSDCIFDLIDNSVDAAWGGSGATPTTFKSGDALAAFKIDMKITKDRFVISDNCGGISLDQAAEYAFTFGRDELDAHDGYTVGVYGIGMKRAVFKLGTDIAVRSTALEDSFVVPINVPDWLEDKRTVWDFDIEQSDPLGEDGVEIQVSDLSDETKDVFSDPAFVNRLKAIVSRDYILPLMQGLQIWINGVQLKGWDMAFKDSAEYTPMRETYSNDKVTVEIIAGMTALPPNSIEPSERNKEDDGSGWYVLCNGRVVVAADRTSLTVWGRDKFPIWHPQYEGFIGIVLFSSKEPSLLPMTTTKRSIDVGSSFYRSALVKMRIPTRAWIDYTNSRKHKKDEARKRESAAKNLVISSVKPRKSIKLPREISGDANREANVLYSVPLKRMRFLAKAFGKSTMQYKEVGMRSFDYAYDRLVEED